MIGRGFTNLAAGIKVPGVCGSNYTQKIRCICYDCENEDCVVPYEGGIQTRGRNVAHDEKIK